MENSLFNALVGPKFKPTRYRFYHRYYVPRNNTLEELYVVLVKMKLQNVLLNEAVYW